MATAILSLVISVYTLVITSYEPELLLIMPNQVRIAQGGESGPLLYLQPMFVSKGPSERVEVITAVRLKVEALGQSRTSADFVWDEQGAWVVDPATQELNWVFSGDPGPFVVSAKNGQFFTGLFKGPPDWLFESGRYRLAIIADQVSTSQPLSSSIEIVLAGDDVDCLNQSAGKRYLTFSVSK